MKRSSMRSAKGEVSPVLQGITVTLLLCAAILGGSYLIYHFAQQALLQTIRTQLLSVAEAANSFTDKDLLETLISPEQKNTPLFA